MTTTEHTDLQLSAVDVPPAQRARAVRAVASASVDAGECATLLDMLGLSPDDGVPAERPFSP